MNDKILIIRLSSIGDIIQCMSVVSGIKEKYPNSEIHWVVRSDLASLLKIDPRIDHLWEFDRKKGFKGVIELGFQLRKEGYDFVYDAHSNIRSNILKAILCPLGLCQLNLVTRYKARFKRFLLFKFRLNLLPKPFKALASFQKPIEKWGIQEFNVPFEGWLFKEEINQKVDALVLSQIPDNVNWITIVPSAAWSLKRWPVEYWRTLAELKSDCYFVILGGPNDSFCEEIRSVAPERIINLAGKTSLIESFCVVRNSQFVISGDTGFLHAADLFHKKGIALIGPTAFGFPSSPNIKVMEVNLPCRPCTKDGSVKCKLKEEKKCLYDIKPEMVAAQIDLMIE